MEAFIGQIAESGLPVAKVDFVYYIHPVGPSCKKKVAEYLAAIGLDPGRSQVSVHYSGTTWPAWRVDPDFLGKLLALRLENDYQGFGFVSFRQRADDPSSFIEYSPVAHAPIDEALAWGDVSSLGRVIRLYPRGRR